MKEKILTAMSGGVDSAVTAALLKHNGFDVVGVTLKLCDESICAESSCSSEKEIADAKAVADMLEIPHLVIEKTADFTENVIRPFCESYANGETPNPCVLCNPRIKFGLLCRYAKDEGFSALATGHYAKVFYSEKYGRKVVAKALDPKKDQSYMLWMLSREEIDMAVFPLGERTKDENRAYAKENGLSVSQKKDSQDICFIKDTDYASFVERFLGKTFAEGDFVTEDGKILGRHKGLIRYTVGQRKGLGLALPAPLYVKEKRIADNQVVLVPENRLFSRELTASQINFQAIDEPCDGESFRALVKVRYQHPEQPATVTYSRSDGTLHVLFDEPQRALTAGQSAVCYDEDGVILCGGIIS